MLWSVFSFGSHQMPTTWRGAVALGWRPLARGWANPSANWAPTTSRRSLRKGSYSTVSDSRRAYCSVNSGLQIPSRVPHGAPSGCFGLKHIFCRVIFRRVHFCSKIWICCRICCNYSVKRATRNFRLISKFHRKNLFTKPRFSVRKKKLPNRTWRCVADSGVFGGRRRSREPRPRPGGVRRGAVEHGARRPRADGAGRLGAAGGTQWRGATHSRHPRRIHAPDDAVHPEGVARLWPEAVQERPEDGECRAAVLPLSFTSVLSPLTLSHPVWPRFTPVLAPSRPVLPCLAPSHPISPRLTTSRTVSPRLTPPHPVSPPLTLSHPISPHLTPSHPLSPCLTLSHPISPHLIPSHPTSPHLSPSHPRLTPSCPVSPHLTPSPLPLPLPGDAAGGGGRRPGDAAAGGPPDGGAARGPRAHQWRAVGRRGARPLHPRRARTPPAAPQGPGLRRRLPRHPHAVLCGE